MTSCAACKHFRRLSETFPGWDGRPRHGVCMASYTSNDNIKVRHEESGQWCKWFEPRRQAPEEAAPT